MEKARNFVYVRDAIEFSRNRQEAGFVHLAGKGDRGNFAVTANLGIIIQRDRTPAAGERCRFDMVSRPYKYLMNFEPFDVTRVTGARINHPEDNRLNDVSNSAITHDLTRPPQNRLGDREVIREISYRIRRELEVNEDGRKFRKGRGIAGDVG